MAESMTECLVIELGAVVHWKQIDSAKIRSDRVLLRTLAPVKAQLHLHILLSLLCTPIRRSVPPWARARIACGKAFTLLSLLLPPALAFRLHDQERKRRQLRQLLAATAPRMRTMQGGRRACPPPPLPPFLQLPLFCCCRTLHYRVSRERPQTH